MGYKTPEEICADLEKISPLALPEYLSQCDFYDRSNAYEVLEKAVDEFKGKGGVAGNLLDTTLHAVANSTVLCLLRKFNEPLYKKIVKTKSTDFARYVDKALHFTYESPVAEGKPGVVDAVQQDMLRRNMVRQPGDPVDGKFTPQFDAKNYTGRRDADWKGGVRSSDFPKGQSEDGRTVRGVGGQSLFVNKEDTGGDRSRMAEGDHVTPLETIHARTGYFAERYVDLDKKVEVEYKGPDGKVKKHKLTILQKIANDDANFQVLSGDVNAAKGGNMTNAAYVDQCEKAETASKLYREMETASPERKAELEKEVGKLKLRPSFKKAARQMANEEKLSPEEREKLKKYKPSEETKRELRENQKRSEAAIRNEMLKAGGETVLKEQIGKLVEVMIGPLGFEMRDMIKNGITHGFEDCNAFEAFCKRLWRALKYMFSKLGEILKGLLGDLAKMLTTFFVGLCKAIRDFFGKFFDLALSGISVLVESVKVLLGNGTAVQKGDAIMKILVGFATGILGQTVIDTLLESIGLPEPFSDIVASLLSALISTLVMALFDKLDLFGVKRDMLRQRIDEIFDARKRALEAAYVNFDMAVSQTMKRHRLALETLRGKLASGLSDDNFDVVNEALDSACELFGITLPYRTPREFLLYLRENDSIVIN